jgi:pimeloyl-ACP methyl ester esterase
MRLLLVHGWATSPAVWDGQGALDRRFDLLPVHLPGHGGEGRWGEPGLGPGIRMIESILMDGRPTLAVGWSLGGALLFALAARGLPALKGVVSVGAFPSFVRREDFPFGLRPAAVLRMKKDILNDPEETLERFYALNFSETEKKKPDYDRWFSILRDARKDLIISDLLNGLDALLREDLRERLSEIRLPVLLIHGTEDGVCPYPVSSFLLGTIAGSRRLTMNGSGHAPFLTRSLEFNRAIEEFASDQMGS